MRRPLLYLTGACVLLVLARTALARDDWVLSVLWNIVLAWMPLGFARLAGRRRLWWIPWLAFLPNSLYLVTSLVHLHRGPHFSLDAALFGLTALLGLGLGIAALAPAHAAIERRFGISIGWAFVVAATLVSGFGVYLGRVRRWNSWDLVTHPGATLTDALARLGDGHAVALTFAAFAVYLAAYAVVPRETRMRSSS